MLKISTLSFALLICFSCSKKESTVTPLNTTNVVNNTVNAKNTLILKNFKAFDYENPDSLISAGNIIKILGNNDSIVAQGTTDASGNLTIENLQVGTYDIQYSRPGYSTLTCFSVYIAPGPKSTIFSPRYNSIYRSVGSTVNSVSFISKETNPSVYKFKANLTVGQTDKIDKLGFAIMYRKSGSNLPFMLMYDLYPSISLISGNDYRLSFSNFYLQGSSGTTFDLIIIPHALNLSNLFIQAADWDYEYKNYIGAPSPPITFTQ